MPKPSESTPFSDASGESKWLIDLEKTSGPRPSLSLSTLLDRLDSTLVYRINATIDKFLDMFSKKFYQDDNCK